MSYTFSFPIVYPEGCQNFPDALQERFNEYHEYLHSIDCSTSIIEEAKKFSNSIINSINKYYTGRVYDAYGIFRESLRENVSNFKQEFVETLCEKKLFRARKEKNNQEVDFDKKDLFHIKFEDRTRVQNQRFSISGLPCLYMAESLFACWVEMGRPSIDIFTAASIDIDGDVNIFDMSKMYDLLASGDDNDIIKYANFIHLVIATSFSVRDKQGEFKPEYIIPQFIMQWLLDNDYGISGVKYYCTSRCPDIENKRLFINYAFPTKGNKSFGFCSDLERIFKIKRVVPGRCIQYYNKNPVMISYDIPPECCESIEIAVGLKRNYMNSMFGIFETVLTADPLHMDDGDICMVIKQETPSTPEA